MMRMKEILMDVENLYYYRESCTISTREFELNFIIIIAKVHVYYLSKFNIDWKSFKTKIKILKAKGSW